MREMRPVSWYDGLVDGLIRFRGLAGWFYASLLAWSPKMNERVYVLVPIDDQTAERFRVVLAETPEPATEEHWSLIQQEVSRLREEGHGTVRLIRCRALGEPFLSSADLDIDDFGVRSYLGQSLELAVGEEEIEKWLGLLPVGR